MKKSVINLKLYETGADRREDRLDLARIQVAAAHDKGMNIDSQLSRLVNNYRVLEFPSELRDSLT